LQVSSSRESGRHKTSDWGAEAVLVTFSG
jgi:hypothetical protein